MIPKRLGVGSDQTIMGIICNCNFQWAVVCDTIKINAPKTITLGEGNNTFKLYKNSQPLILSCF